MSAVVVTRADREAAVDTLGACRCESCDRDNGYWSFVNDGDETTIDASVPAIAHAIATARAEGYAAGVEEAANVVLAHAREAASRAGEVATDAEAKAACMALALDAAAKDVRALAAREGER